VVAGVEVELPAAGLRLRKLDLVPEPLEEPNSRDPHLGEHGVVDAGNEQEMRTAQIMIGSARSAVR
jgi:hypothetical protein